MMADDEDTKPDAPAPKKKRGFAAMDKALVAQIASKGGKAAHLAGTAHEFNSDKAREAGRKGGRAMRAKLAAGRPDTAGTVAQNDDGEE
jgi:general stress protein YciG